MSTYVQADAYLDARRRYRPANFFQSVLKAMTTLYTDRATGRTIDYLGATTSAELTSAVSDPFPAPAVSRCVRSSASRTFGLDRRLRAQAFLDIFQQSLQAQQCSLTSGNCLGCTLIVPQLDLTRHGFLRFEFASVYERWTVKIGLEDRSN